VDVWYFPHGDWLPQRAQSTSAEAEEQQKSIKGAVNKFTSQIIARETNVMKLKALFYHDRSPTPETLNETDARVGHGDRIERMSEAS
jgi:hypothetical protein